MCLKKKENKNLSGQNCEAYNRNTGGTYLTYLEHSSKLLYFKTALLSG